MKRFGLYGAKSQDFLTYGGRVITHTDRAELEWLTVGAEVREVPPSIPPERCLPIQHHPKFEHVTFPLTKEQFR
jgi:hypothetical protein